jgi:protein involved in polysaccharide export with SLBB domain
MSCRQATFGRFTPFLSFLWVVAGILWIFSGVAVAQDSTGISNPLTGLSPDSQSPYSTGAYPGLDGSDVDANGQRQGSSVYGQRNLNNGSATQNQDLTRRYNSEQDRTRLESYQLPPDPPTEFQKLILSSTGSFLPIYGAKLFRNLPSTFAPLDRVPVTPDYVIGPGDELLIQIWGQVTLNSRFVVDRAGNIYIPQVGTVRVTGLAFGQLQEFLKSQVSKVFRNFDLNVNMGELRSIQVFVVGQARRPGSYTISSLSTLVDAVFVTGGPSPAGSLRHIQLKRAGKVITDLDLYDLLAKGDKSGDAQLLPGDVIYIPPVGPQVAVAGAVNTPGIYELKSDGTTVDDLVKLAAGVATVASTEMLRLERIDEHRMRSVREVHLDAEGMRTTLRDGDLLEFVPVIDRFRDGVTLRGNVANPGRYQWHAGMRVGELFPDKDALITRDYWLRRGRLGQPVLTYVPVCPPRRARTMQGMDGITQNDSRQNSNPNNGSGSYQDNRYDGNTTTSSPLAPPNEWDQQGCVQLPERYSQDQSGETQQYEQGGLNGTGYPGNGLNGTQARQGEPAGQLGPDRMDENASMNASRGSAASAMVDRSSNQFPPRNDVKLSAPDIDWSYAVIERQNKETLKTSLISFDLGRLVLQHDQTHDPELEPGDVITIFSKADIRVPQAQQTRFVRLEGEFRNAGVYSVEPGDTLRSLVARAGGFTENAYLYGSEFTRESTRRVQQQRLNDYINEVALQATTTAVNSANRSINALDTAASAAAASQSQAVVARLRAMRATGRIVLNLKPDSATVDTLPDLPLEDGDVFIVPHTPSTINVTGAVYNANAFLYDGHRRLSDYLKLAGGSNRDADRKSAYVIRADGSVVSRRQISAWHKDAYDSLRIYPGDTVVVPLNLSKGTGLRNVVDIAQIVGQFGVAVAAANLVF